MCACVRVRVCPDFASVLTGAEFASCGRMVRVCSFAVNIARIGHHYHSVTQCDTICETSVRDKPPLMGLGTMLDVSMIQVGWYKWHVIQMNRYYPCRIT